MSNNKHNYINIYTYNDEINCHDKLCIVIYDDLDVEYKQEENKITIHGIMYNFYLNESYEKIIESIERSKYTNCGFIESEYKDNNSYDKLHKINIGDYCIIKETYVDDRHGIFDKIISISSLNKVSIKSGWIRRENLLFLDKLKINAIIEKCSCDE